MLKVLLVLGVVGGWFGERASGEKGSSRVLREGGVAYAAGPGAQEEVGRDEMREEEMPAERRAAREELRKIPRSRREQMQAGGNRVMEELRRAGPWEEQYGMMMDSLQRVFERNEWTSESDQFALDMVAHVEAIPPWEFQERFEAISGLIRDRYNLDPEQEETLRAMFMKEMIRTFAQHGDRIFEYSAELLKTRADRAAITPEQVQRWAEIGRPVIDDVRQRMEQMVEAFSAELRPEQREVLERDAKAAFRRVDRVSELARGWAKGEWRADDWGMEEDPIQTEGEREGRYGGKPEDATRREANESREAGEVDAAGRRAERRTGGVNPDEDEEIEQRVDERRRRIEAEREARRSRGDREDPRRERRTGEDEHRESAEPDRAMEESAERGARSGREMDPPRPERREEPGRGKEPDDEWGKYVKSFIAKYKLDEGQQSRAWVIYRDLKQRGDKMRTRIDGIVKPLEAQLGTTKDAAGRERLQSQIASAKKPLDQMFEDLKRRLEGLPTRAQRKEAESSAGGGTKSKSGSKESGKEGGKGP